MLLLLWSLFLNCTNNILTFLNILTTGIRSMLQYYTYSVHPRKKTCPNSVIPHPPKLVPFSHPLPPNCHQQLIVMSSLSPPYGSLCYWPLLSWTTSSHPLDLDAVQYTMITWRPTSDKLPPAHWHWSHVRQCPWCFISIMATSFDQYKKSRSNDESS